MSLMDNRCLRRPRYYNPPGLQQVPVVNRQMHIPSYDHCRQYCLMRLRKGCWDCPGALYLETHRPPYPLWPSRLRWRCGTWDCCTDPVCRRWSARCYRRHPGQVSRPAAADCRQWWVSCLRLCPRQTADRNQCCFLNLYLCHHPSSRFHRNWRLGCN